MEERIKAPVLRCEPAAQILEIVDPVDGFVADDFFQDMRGRRPVEAAEHQEAPVEPGIEQVPECQ